MLKSLWSQEILTKRVPHLSLVHVEEPDAQNDAGELLLYSLLTSSFEFWTWEKDGMKYVNTTSTRLKSVAYLCFFAMTLTVVE